MLANFTEQFNELDFFSFPEIGKLSFLSINVENIDWYVSAGSKTISIFDVYNV